MGQAVHEVPVCPRPRRPRALRWRKHPVDASITNSWELEDQTHQLEFTNWMLVLALL